MLFMGGIILFISFAGLLQTYLIYPLLVKLLAHNKKENQVVYSPEDPSLPIVSIISSLYNEEQVIGEKLESLLKLSYPLDKISIWIGSDCSDDTTNEIVSGYAEKASNIHFFPFEERRGKPPVINELVSLATKENKGKGQHILIITDANVMLDADALYHLVKHFKNEEVALVDAHMIHHGMQSEGISKAENQYISQEVLLKNREGKLWGTMIGPFGGCYAIKADFFHPVPANFLVDDFYIAMQVLAKGGKTLNDLDAKCFEAVSHEIQEEYKRKRRIAAGNFQNMLTFHQLWWPPFSKLGFAFFSHKILRWIGPFLILGMLLGLGIMAVYGNLVYKSLFAISVTGLILIPGLDWILSKLKIHLPILRALRYFILMNAAFFEGFIKYIKGIKSNVWQPPKRN